MLSSYSPAKVGSELGFDRQCERTSTWICNPRFPAAAGTGVAVIGNCEWWILVENILDASRNLEAGNACDADCSIIDHIIFDPWIEIGTCSTSGQRLVLVTVSEYLRKGEAEIFILIADKCIMLPLQT